MYVPDTFTYISDTTHHHILKYRKCSWSKLMAVFSGWYYVIPLLLQWAPLGSAVLLSCSFGSTSLGISPGYGWVVWNQISGSGASLVNITSSGKVDFLDPRQGRVKAFPNQGGLGNFSIRIDALQASDLGSYCCELQSNDQCHRVEVEELDQDSRDLQVLFFSVGGVAVLIVLLCGCFCWVKWTRSSTLPEDVACSDDVGRDVAQKRGAGNERPIYENNEHDPTRMQHEPTRIQQNPTRIQQDPTTIQYDPTGIQHEPPRNQHEPPRHQHEPARYQNKPVRDLSEKRRGFHRELMSRLRQSSLGQHYYANQAEINEQARAQIDSHQRANEAETNQEGRFQMDNRQRGSFWRKKPKEKCEYKNPIYNKSTDQINK
ncbi:uncharacterized protein LOC118366487 isoform X2 [Oncorhynchus keta]|uniref:uncharacterized protein LOC118366487 isoform X2 n=1 Tax=Oncorhynchus keta TaxID=8018 RepID=UPI0015FAE606|nr:uncharacterized protein LOC118366487 isoform X2 [Oncorhynchus keta]